MEAVVYWQPEIDPSTVIVSGRRLLPAQPVVRLPEMSRNAVRRDLRSVSAELTTDGETLHLLFIDDARSGEPLTAVVPLDDGGLDRIEALVSLWRLLHDRPPCLDPRLTAQRRRRLRTMLQAVDGHLDGATYRDIAQVLFGKARVADDPWKTSALRDSTIALVRDGRALIDGGYRALLRRCRRP